MIELNVGDTAPEFDLPVSDSKRVKLSDLLGKKVVLYFYPKDDTQGCTLEAKDFSCLADEFARLGVRVLGVSPDGVKQHDKFCKKHALNLTLLSDEQHSTLEEYGVWVEKSMYGRKYMGVERTTFLIDERGKIAHIWRKVRVPNHAHLVLSFVKEANAQA